MVMMMLMIMMIMMMMNMVIVMMMMDAGVTHKKVGLALFAKAAFNFPGFSSIYLSVLIERNIFQNYLVMKESLNCPAGTAVPTSDSAQWHCIDYKPQILK